MRSTLVVCLLLVSSVASGQLYKAERGPHGLKVVENHTLADPGREIPLRLTFPADGGPYPVLIWCHGALGSKDAYQPLVEHWASHGYVVIQPTFGDSLVYLDADDRRAFKTAAAAVNSPHVMKQWNKRPAEVSHVIDKLDELAATVDGLAGKMDAKRLAVGGHSYGAHTSMLIGGVEPRVLGRGRSMRDERVQAVLLVSPSGESGLLKSESFAKLAAPALVVTGDNDGSPVRGQEGKTGSWRREVYDASPAGGKYLLWIDGAHHNFGGISGAARWAGAGPENPQQVKLVATTCLAFLDATLKKLGAAEVYMDDADGFARAAGGAARLEGR